MADQRIQGINAIAIARGTSEPTNTDVLWLDDNIEGNIYTRLKVYVEGSWELISRVPSQVLDDLRSVDGAGSGLDADTLRGYTPEQLIEEAGGEEVPDLGVGELLVGQTDNTGIAKTVGGIVTMDADGNMLYVTNSISHTGLTDVGTNTHAQIDSHISSTSNPHGVTAGQVGNTVAQWNADKIEGNTTNIGSLGAAQDGQVMIWDNATSRFIMGAAGAENLNDLTDVNTGLPVPTTEADTGKLLYYDHSSGEWKTDEAVTHGTVVINGKKDSAGTIAKGLPVYLVGFDSDLHTVELADANNASEMPVIGFSAESMNNTDSKHIITFGKLEGVDTTSTVSQLNPNGETWAVNDVLYISTNTGGLTKVRPTGSGSFIQRVAKVLKVDATGGQIFIFNTARTAGLPNLTTDNVWVGDVNGYPQMVNKSTLVSTGVFGITNTSGEYTYYTTIQLALAAASSGDVIEQFADVSVSTASSITLDKDITWNMNGYEYKNTSTSSFIMLNIPNATTINLTINNGKIIRNTGAGNGGVLFYMGNQLDTEINSNGVIYHNVEGQSVDGKAEITGGTFKSDLTSGTGFYFQGIGHKIKVISNQLNQLVNTQCRIYDSYFYASVDYTYMTGGSICYNTTFESPASYGVRVAVNCEINTCIGKGLFGAIFAQGGKIYNSTGISSGGFGIELSTSTGRAYNCVGISPATNGCSISGLAEAYNCTAISSSGYAVTIQNDGKFKNGVAISTYNNASGHGFYISSNPVSGGFEIIGNQIITANASANGITGVALAEGKWAQNIFKGMTNTIGLSTANLITNTTDNQGNILL